MLIVLGLVFGALLGAGAHFALPHRQTRGVAVGPMLGALVGTATWTALTWAGTGPDQFWIWAAAIVVPAVVTAAAIVLLSRARIARDAAERARLGIA
ncbi:hypothetical protein KZX37_10660 [Microbacterium sp. EYE_5]|uniref:hypothetical protein n=1 Tax=unclassified Microbacterium TaxID=2609290 RepID=UPI002004B7E3|nr:MULTISPECIES: hypothetical protein [unclassified Microbacterium]MCK6081023.1 hypothetical protein [Microbacterium sp. EYE_382]MCK6086293.1 hypothetical protein [Microbacterium sp. EYE_384]MCK6124209.1 hypothetical protein [Microbacterium sp. EYE_80]MCK6127118.1 hypothetical protein [Microbacterium sp. EYE_79]MCK6141978.1 hypothetical protein [Microbacterium sp. EYE_39]